MDGRVSELQISYVGYKTKTVKIPSGGPLAVTLEPDEHILQEAVVIGYGVQRKSDLTGSVSSVNSKDFNQGVVNSPEALVNGKVSGMQIISSGGSPSAGSTIRIRGGASLNASNDPLIVLDGMPMEVGGSVSGSGNFLSLINPNDIESMTILKDASETAQYGCVLDGHLRIACLQRCHHHHHQEGHQFRPPEDHVLLDERSPDSHPDG